MRRGIGRRLGAGTAIAVATCIALTSPAQASRANQTPSYNPPYLGIGAVSHSVCAGLTTYVDGRSFVADATYSFTASVGTITATQAARDDGTFAIALQLPADTAAGTAVVIDAYSQDDPLTPVAETTLYVDPPTVWNQSYAGTYVAAGDKIPVLSECFIPGETVTFASTAAGLKYRPVTVDPYGQLSNARGDGLVQLALTSINTTGTVIITGHISSGRPVKSRIGITAAEDTLTIGRSLLGQWDGGLESPSHVYRLRVYAGRLAVEKFKRSAPNDGSGATLVWQPAAAPDENVLTSQLTMRADGDLVFSGPNGVLWRSHTRGSGSHDRLVMQNNGILAVYTGHGRLAWSSKAGRLLPRRA